MNTSAKLAVTALVLLSSHDAMAQMFKCTDAAGKVTYSSTRCAELGLKDAGQVQDRIQVTPAPPQPAARPSAGSAERDREAPKPPPAAKAEPTDPDRRCFTTNVKGKSVTRCNDKPDE